MYSKSSCAILVFFLFLILFSGQAIASTTVTDTSIVTTGNLTLGEKIVFNLGEAMDNIIDGWITITGNFNITGNATVSGTSLRVNNQEVCLADGTNCQSSSDTLWNLTGSQYLYNDSNILSVNETKMNATIDARDSDTTYDFQCSTGQFVKNLTSGGSYVCDSPVGGSEYVSLYSSGNFNGSLYTTGADPTASDSNSIFQVIGSSGVPRLQIQNGGAGQASFIARSFLIVNENTTRLNQSQNDLCSEWGFTSIDCNSSTTGADMGVQDDFEVQGLVYANQGLCAGTANWGSYLLLGNLSTYASGGINGSFIDSTDIFCDTVSNPFTAAQVGNNTWIFILDGAYEGTTASMNTYINSSCVVVSDNPAWNTDLSDQTFEIRSSPVFVVSDGGSGTFYVESDKQSKFEVKIKNGTGSHGFSVRDTAGAHQHKSAFFETNVNGFNGVNSLLSQMFSNVPVESADTSNLLLEFVSANFNNSHQKFIDVRISGEKASGMTVDLFELQGDFDSYIKQGEAESISKVYYDNGSGSITDITSFATSSATNTSIFEEDNSIVYIGGTTNFSQITIALATSSSVDINAEFYYCNSSNEWEAYVGAVSDTTAGFTTSGSVSTSSPLNRGTCNQEINGTPFADTTNYTYIAIKRTRNNIITVPVELYFAVGGSTNTFILAEDYIKLGGASVPPLACGSTVDGAIYYDSDVQFHCSCKSGTGWVQMNDYSTACS